MTDYHVQTLKLMRNSETVTRHSLASAMNISLSLVNRLVNDLFGANLIRVMGQVESGGGRPADLLALNPQAGYAVGIDYGEKHQSAVITDLSGRVVHRLFEKVTPTERQTDVVDSLLGLVQTMTAAAGVPVDQVLGLGIGVRDIVDASTGVVYGSGVQPGWGSVWVNFPLRDALRDRTSLPFIVVDDIVRAMGTAEVIHSTKSRGKDIVFILADEGIGMAIMIDGKPFTGFSHIAGEIGHVPVDIQPMCTCGNHGCLCLHAATVPILEKVHQRLTEQPLRSALRQIDPLEIDQVLQAAQQGDKLAYQVLTEAGEYLGRGLAVVVNLLGPQRIVIGGKLAEADAYTQAAYRMIKISALDRASRFVQVERSEMGEVSGPLGAATLALNALFDPGVQNLYHQVSRGVEKRAPKTVSRG